MRPFAYLAWTAGTFIGLCCFAVALGIAVDPYRVFGTPAIIGWTSLRPRIYEQADMAKTYQLERIAPRTLLLGNSRVEIGIDPASALWPKDARPVFNASEAGRGLRTALRMLRDAIAVRPPDRAFLGLDILDFLERPSSPAMPLPPPDAEDRRLLVDRDGRPNPERTIQIWRDRFAATLTIDAVLDSIETLLDQDPETSVTMTAVGFNPLRNYKIYVQRDGYYGLFAQKNAIYLAQYRQHPKPDFADLPRYASFRYLERILRLAGDHNVRLVLFIHPYHADYLEMLHEVGLWPSFEAWKRGLVKIVDTADAKRPGSVRLFDFSGYDALTTERTPPRGDRRSQMRWYWEPGHYKSALGDRMLARMLGGHEEFGRLLTTATIDQDLADIRANRARFIAQREARRGG